MAGKMGNNELSAFNGLINVLMVLFCIFRGILAAASIRVGFHVGA